MNLTWSTVYKNDLIKGEKKQILFMRKSGKHPKKPWKIADDFHSK